MSIIEVKNLSFSYGENSVLENINFTVEKNQMVTIVGPNGGGKTTLLLLLLGLLTGGQGEILVNGQHPASARRIMGYVPQYSLFDPHFPVTVHDVVLMGSLSKPFGFYSSAARQKAENALSTVGLGDLYDRPFSDLSGGQRQRVLIARALVANPEILMLDEPTANVDALVGGHLNGLLQELNKNMTILLVTHDMGFVSNLTTRVFCINRNLAEHPARELGSGPVPSVLYGTDVVAVDHHVHLEAGRSGTCDGGCCHG